ncbi:hypothetical protein BH23ACT9_BH23ACT9_35850 [soil metagenome]
MCWDRAAAVPYMYEFWDRAAPVPYMWEFWGGRAHGWTAAHDRPVIRSAAPTATGSVLPLATW